MSFPGANGRTVAGRRLPGVLRLLTVQWAILLLAILVIGAVIRPTKPTLPAGVESAPENHGIYGGWVPSAHPLGTFRLDDSDQLELLLMGLSRTMIGPLFACLVAVALGGLWGAWAAYREGLVDRLLTSLSLFFEAFPRIILFALVIRVVRVPGLHVNLLHVTVLFGLFQIPAIGMALRNHLRSIVREGYVEGLVSLGFSSRTIVLRDLLWRECGPLLRLQYVARVTELVALETAVSYALGGMDERTIGWVLRQYQINLDPRPFELLVVGCLALVLLSLSAYSRWQMQASAIPNSESIAEKRVPVS